MMHQYDRQCEKFRSKCKDLRVEKLRMRKSHHRKRQLHWKFSNHAKSLDEEDHGLDGTNDTEDADERDLGQNCELNLYIGRL